MSDNFLVLVINCGSSSLKFAVMGQHPGQLMVEGIADKLGSSDSSITFKYQGTKVTHPLEESSHAAAISAIREWLNRYPHIAERLVGIGHRVVHGGETFTSSALIDQDVLQGIEDCARFAPLHNPAHLIGINEAARLFAGLDQVAVFDTAFHQTLSPEQFLYPIPMRYYRNNRLRKFGFHGSSYRYVAERFAQIKPDAKAAGLIIAHLGNGASVCAVQQGQARDTSMGITPLEGMMMGTRSGSLDPSLITFMKNADNISSAAALDILNKESGLLGVSELSNDCRTLEEAMLAGDEKAQLALDMFASRAAKQIASVATTLDSFDALIFTGGIGENSSYIRAGICRRLAFAGVRLDSRQNDETPRGAEASIGKSTPEIWIIPTNEELMIARDTLSLVINRR
ncbi:acetate kinase [Maribrevibacterium harenarium]|uniref:Acetate kinase n=1 Tax=Maribrevibacterium harenarium TaxID=2589817 RepID=A0A501X558_9GAMM|nr:acetate kinase [Maribrevibacterium harenarium]TPE55614.1 acetate kinase [Maribrevibacterium harenarium]